MNTHLPAPDPGDEEIGQGIAAIEAHLAAHAPAAQDGVEEEFDGQTRRVRRLRAQVAEARALADLQRDDTPLLLDSPRVRRRRRAAHEAERLHALAADPAMRAWQAARMRRLLVAAAMVSLTLALAWSTAGVQAFAADGAPEGSPGWWFAWFVEPFMSLALLVVVGAKAYMGTRGQPITSPTLRRIEFLFLGLTVSMNGWPYAPWSVEEFSFSRLVLHLLGPVVAVAIVTALPIILEAFAGLDHDPTGAPTAPTYRHNVPADRPAGRADIRALADRARDLIDAGALPAHPSATALRQALRCGTDIARQVRDELRNQN